MPRDGRWFQELATNVDRLGLRLGGGPLVGIDAAFVALPLDGPADDHTEPLG